MAQIGFVGLGVMGGPMAGHLARAGHNVKGFRRDRDAAEAWARGHSAALAATPEEAAQGADFLILCVSRDADVAEVFARALPCLPPGAVIVDHSTISAELARDLAAKAQLADVTFLDAPVSGGQAGAEAGRLTVMAGGEAEALMRVRPVLEAYAAHVTHMGPPGTGQLAKMVNQICIAGIVQGLAEGLHFAERAGLEIGPLIQAISGGAAQSWQMDHRWRSMSEGRYDFGFAVELMRKDLGLVLDEGRRRGASLPATALIDQFYAEVEALGGARWDTSSLLARLNAQRR